MPWNMREMALAVLLCFFLGACQTAEPTQQWMDHQGHSHTLEELFQTEILVLFWVDNTCPIVQQSLPKMERLRAEYSKDGVRFLFVNAKGEDTLEDIQAHAEEFAVMSPILLDRSQTLTQSWDVSRTGEVLVLNRKRDLLYRGAVDDRFDYGARRPVREDYLKDTLEAILTGSKSVPKSTEAKGCLIERAGKRS